ncbi:MAG: MBOAT family protein [Bacteroidales bacterium]|nr:MBOAT family protein [Bacteroidales bacterium]
MAFVPVYILILGFTIVIDYFAGIFLESAEGRKRKLYLIISLCANIGVLSIFKYFNFLNDNFTALLDSFSQNNPIPNLSILLPIGLSFHTFQAMSYTIEVYRGKQKAERHFGIYALYVMFFPQLVAGPIERPMNLLPQFYKEHDFDSNRIIAGLKLMVWGFFKKLVIADRLAIYVNTVYDNPAGHTGLTLILATTFFAFQIYCDFSGYTDIAIGAAKVLGFDLMKNFNHPYLSRTVAEFWKRWHISLSTWFKDYLYIPLGGNRVSTIRLFLNLLIVFLISGLWHGANWTYVIWGGLNGIYLIFAMLTGKIRSNISVKLGFHKIPHIYHAFQILSTFVLICISWVFFRAKNVSDAFVALKNMSHFDGPIFYDRADFSSVAFALMGLFFLIMVEAKREYYPLRFNLLSHQNRWIQNISYALLILGIVLFGVFDGGQFIYFQF